ncbi:hypothetical protein TNCV_742121 [Trichonephila clavipes]|nr:hypothetical protein TNCV_742121 [Trichonephila clavipes]
MTATPKLRSPLLTATPSQDIGPQQFSYTRYFGDEPRNFERWSSDVDDTLAGTPSPNYHGKPMGGRLSS